MIDKFYSDIVSSLVLATDKCIPCSTSCDFKIIPGWNDLVKDKYDISRNAFLLWNLNGKQRQVYTLSV